MYVACPHCAEVGSRDQVALTYYRVLTTGPRDQDVTIRPATAGECTQSDIFTIYAAIWAGDVRRVLFQDEFTSHYVYRVKGGFLVRT